MDNKAIAGILYETADLLEIDGQDSFRIRSYRNAAEAVEAHPQQIADLIDEPKKLLEIPGIGKGMLLNLQELFTEGNLKIQAELLNSCNQLYVMRSSRLSAVQGHVPGAVWWIVFLGAVITTGYTYFFGCHNFAMHLAMIGILAATLALVVVLIIDLDRPFRGAISVSPDGRGALLVCYCNTVSTTETLLNLVVEKQSSC